MRAQWNLFYLLLLFSQSRLTLANPMDCSLPGSSVHGISQTKILEWAAISYSRDLPNSGMEPAALQVSCISGRFFTTEPLGKPEAAQSLISIEILKLKNLFNVFIVSLMQKLIFFFYWSISWFAMLS